jgi:hypothetical protein
VLNGSDLVHTSEYERLPCSGYVVFSWNSSYISGHMPCWYSVQLASTVHLSYGFITCIHLPLNMVLSTCIHFPPHTIYPILTTCVHARAHTHTHTHTHSFQQRVSVMKLLIMQFSPVSYYFIPVGVIHDVYICTFLLLLTMWYLWENVCWWFRRILNHLWKLTSTVPWIYIMLSVPTLLYQCESW